jgi:arabinose-5-phosphate isomerase
MTTRPRLDVVGIGSMAADRIVRVPRILGADEKGIVHAGAASGGEYVGGVVLNHLGWAAVLGLRCGIFGRQADDPPGRFLRGAMDRLGITRDIILDGSASTVADIYVDDTGDRAIYMRPGATSETTPEMVRERHADFIRNAARLTTEVSQLPLAAAREALAIAVEAGVATLVDLDVPPSDAVPGLGTAEDLDALLRAAQVLKPSKAAARELAPDAGGDALALARALRARFGNRAVVVTDGEAGCAVAAEDFEDCVAARSVKVADTTGAGDAFLGGLLAALQLELAWPDAARLANACGGACAEKLGAFPDAPAAARARVLELYDGELALRPIVAPAGGGDAALAALDVAIDELRKLRQRSSPEAFEAAAEVIRQAELAGGRVHVTGVGKPEHVASYAAALLSSTGTPATFLHGTEAVHGSAGQVVAGDVVMAISNSGETRELREAVECVRGLGARVIAVTGSPDSWLGREAEVVLDAGVAREGGGLGLAPRASAAAEVVVVAALAALLEESRDFGPADYAARHPSGELGRRARDR